jgi:hypothetical protein
MQPCHRRWHSKVVAKRREKNAGRMDAQGEKREEDQKSRRCGSKEKKKDEVRALSSSRRFSHSLFFFWKDRPKAGATAVFAYLFLLLYGRLGVALTGCLDGDLTQISRLRCCQLAKN